MSVKFVTNFERKPSGEFSNNTSTNGATSTSSVFSSIAKDENLVENMRRLVKEYLEIVRVFLKYS